MNEFRMMRLMVFFDLPVQTKQQQRSYRDFHKFLIQNGFMMLQYSVYTRFCINNTASSKFIARVKTNVPTHGNVKLIVITESQYNNMITLCGEVTLRERTEKNDNLIIID